MSTYYLTGLLRFSIPARLYAALFAQDPSGVASPLTAEIQGKSYHRPAYDWIIDANSILSPTSVLFLGIPAGTYVAAIGLMTSHVGGELVTSRLLDDPVHFTAQGRITLNGLRFTMPADPA